MKKLIYLFMMLVMSTSCNEKQPFEYSSPNFDLIEVTDGVYACIHKLGGKAICNTGIVDNGEETIIFDSFLSPGVAEELFIIVEGAGLSPVKYLVNSHSHNDHVRGNQVFSEDVDIISTKKTAEMIVVKNPHELAAERQYAALQVARYDSLLSVYSGDSTDVPFEQIQLWLPYFIELSDSSIEIKTRLPNVFIEEEKFLNGPQRKVQLLSRGHGHSPGDLVLYLPDDKIIFTGDLVFNDMHPFMGQADLEGWKNWLDFMGMLDIDIIIPGHGTIGDSDELDEMRNYIRTIENIAEDMIAKELTPADIASVEIPEEYKAWSHKSFFTSNLRFMYNQLLKQEE